MAARRTHTTRPETYPVYPAADFLRWADHLDTISRDHCHPALYAIRDQAARRLRRMAEDAENEDNQIAFGGIRFLVYVKPD